MFTHVLLPLDGSRLAESALPAADSLAQAFGASVTLVHVIEQDAPAEVHGQPHLRTPDEADAYLRAVAARSISPGVPVEYHVHTGEVTHVARSIVEHIGDFAADLIVMCTHGRGGLHDLLFGSIAQQVIALGVTPTMIIHPSADEPSPGFGCRRLFIPLDDDPAHQQSVPVAAEIARRCQSAVHVIHIVPTLGTLSSRWSAAGRLLPGTTTRMLDMSVEAAVEYLRGVQQELQNAGISATYDVFRGDPAEVIARAARELGADLIVLGTHGKTGTKAFWSESVGAQVCRSCRIPLLLVPVPKRKSI